MKTAQVTLANSRTASVLRESLFRGAQALGCFFLFVIIIASAHAQSARTTADKRATQSDNSLTAQRVATLRSVSNVLRATAASPLPRGLSAAELAEARRYVAWLKGSAARLDKLAKKGERSIRAANGSDHLRGATENLQAMNMSFNLEYMQLQQKMQNDNRKFTMLSNIMKTKHETAKNAINNIR